MPTGTRGYRCLVLLRSCRTCKGSEHGGGAGDERSEQGRFQSCSVPACCTWTRRSRQRDRGRGLPPDFDVAKGRGLGLQIVRGLARQLKGKIVARTEGGAVFEFTCRV